jgi:N-acetylmuramoyl-L-alanine amidase
VTGGFEEGQGPCPQTLAEGTTREAMLPDLHDIGAVRSPSMIATPSPNTDARPGGVDMLVLHYTGMQSGQAAIDRLRDPVARVSSHYVVDEDGTVYCLVPEELRAWHAGISFWRGRRVLNDGSVGIEIVNPGHEWGYRPFPEIQIASVIALSQGIMARWPIPPGNVVAHSDIAPDRKQDPGELFPWALLARNGIGLWADCDGADLSPALRDLGPGLAALGFDLGDNAPPPEVTLRAFQRHWRQEAVTGLADRGTELRLEALLRARG